MKVRKTEIEFSCDPFYMERVTNEITLIIPIGILGVETEIKKLFLFFVSFFNCFVRVICNMVKF